MKLSTVLLAKEVSFHHQTGLKFKEETTKMLHLEQSSVWWTLQKVDWKHLKSSEMWWWTKIEKINWTYRVRNEILHWVKEERNILHTIQRRKANWIGHILRRTVLHNTLLKERWKKIMGKWGRRHKQLLAALQKMRG